MADLEEPFHVGEEASTGLDPEARKGRDWGMESVACTLVRLNMQNGLEEPFPAAERTYIRGLIRSLGKGVFEGKMPRSCTLVLLNTCGWFGGTIPGGGEGVDLGVTRNGSRRSWLGREQRPGALSF